MKSEDYIKDYESCLELLTSRTHILENAISQIEALISGDETYFSEKEAQIETEIEDKKTFVTAQQNESVTALTGLVHLSFKQPVTVFTNGIIDNKIKELIDRVAYAHIPIILLIEEMHQIILTYDPHLKDIEQEIGYQSSYINNIVTRHDNFKISSEDSEEYKAMLYMDNNLPRVMELVSSLESSQDRLLTLKDRITTLTTQKDDLIHWKDEIADWVEQQTSEINKCSVNVKLIMENISTRMNDCYVLPPATCRGYVFQ